MKKQREAKVEQHHWKVKLKDAVKTNRSFVKTRWRDISLTRKGDEAKDGLNAAPVEDRLQRN